MTVQAKTLAEVVERLKGDIDQAEAAMLLCDALLICGKGQVVLAYLDWRSENHE